MHAFLAHLSLFVSAVGIGPLVWRETRFNLMVWLLAGR